MCTALQLKIAGLYGSSKLTLMTVQLHLAIDKLLITTDKNLIFLLLLCIVNTALFLSFKTCGQHHRSQNFHLIIQQILGSSAECMRSWIVVRFSRNLLSYPMDIAINP